MNRPTQPATPPAVDLADWLDADADSFCAPAFHPEDQEYIDKLRAAAAELRSLRAKLADAERERDVLLRDYNMAREAQKAT